MIQFIFRHPIAILMSLLFHAMLGYGFFLASQNNTSVLKINLNPQGNEQTEETMPLVQDRALKTMAVDANLVAEQIARIQQEEREKIAAQKALEAKARQEQRRLQELKKQQQQAKNQAELEKQKAQESKQKALEEELRAKEAGLLAQLEARKAQESKRLAEIEQLKLEAQKKRAEAEAKKAEQSKQEALLAEEEKRLAQQKIKEAEQQRLAEEAKKKALEAEIKQADLAKKRLEEELLATRLKKEQEEEEAALQRQLAEAAAQKMAMEKTKQLQSLKESYISGIAAKVKDNWKTASNVDSRAECTLAITQTPKGNISNVEVKQCNEFATPQFKKDAENAVLRSAPLPPPPVEELFERNVTFIFKPQ